MRKIIKLATLILLVSSSSIVLAQPINQIIATKSPFPIKIYGMHFYSQKDVISVAGTTYVPVRDFCKALNTNINWNNEKKVVEVGYVDQENISKNSVTIKDYKLTLHDEKSSSKNEERKYFYINVTLKNIGNGVIYINNATEFKIQDYYGNEYNSIPLPGEQSVYEKKLYPGEQYIGAIPFDVPTDFKEIMYTVILKPSHVDGEIREKKSYDPM